MSLPQALYCAVLSFLVVHELDAIRQREWRFFFAPVDVSDQTAFRVFTALHAPLFAAILWYSGAPSFRVGVSLFAIAHAFLHFALRDHPDVEFDTWFSRTWIYGAAGFAAAHLVAVW